MTDTDIRDRVVWNRRRNPLGDFVAGELAALQRRYLNQDPAAAATLARLRREVNAEPGAALAFTDFKPLPVELLGRVHGDDPTRSEIAVHVATTMFAVHQQSQTTQGMHRNGPSFAAAVRSLAREGDASGAVARRFAAAGTATSLSELCHHARGLVTRMRTAGIGFDYGLFADDLHTFLGPGGPSRLRGLWGRDYWRFADRENDNDTTREDQQ